ncbi:MAG: ATPase [Gemmataceae bacterium]
MHEKLGTAEQQVQVISEQLAALYAEIEKVIVGQKRLVQRMLMGLLSGGHLLLEGVPGLAKTLLAKCVAGVLQLKFARIQFTPDLLPADVLGTQVFQPQTGSFSVRRGPIFAHLVLADEINRAPAKVQSALLEAMQEHQVTLGDETLHLPDPFLVIATQNPIEQEGTYPLPEAQVDRFFMKLLVDYPSEEEEIRIVERMAVTAPELTLNPIWSAADILQVRKLVDGVYVDARIRKYIVDIARATRQPEAYGLKLHGLVQYGVSPRGTIALALASRVQALFSGRLYVTPQDIKEVAADVMRHRLILTYEAEAQEWTPDRIVSEVLDRLSVP